MRIPEYMDTLVAALGQYRKLDSSIRGSDTCIGVDLRHGFQLCIFRNEWHRDVFDVQLKTPDGDVFRCDDVVFHDGGRLANFLNEHNV